MRSSIACSRCRRSKIKCVNAGIDTTCRACEASGRECVYPAPATGGGAAKRDIAATLDGDDRNAADWDNPKRQRSRKVVGGAAGSAGKDGGKGLVDVLDSSILSPKVWEALSKSFQTQFATILPFIDSTTLKNQAGQLSASQADAHSEHNPQSPPPRSQLSPLILLGVLALTARFHPQLVAYHSPASASNPSNPSAASEFYASALRARLTVPDGLGLVSPDLVHVQVLLMLALHEWGMCRGKSAWLYVGIAIRLAQAMGLSYELENDPFAAASSSAREASRYAALKMEADHFGMVQRQKEQPEQSSDDVIVQETKRRTFWACFIMDRCLSSGKHRPRMVKVRDLDIQLPSDDAFAFGERVRTSKLSDSPARRASSFDGPGVQIPSLRQSVPYGEDSLRNGSTDSKGWSPVAKRMDSVVDHDIDRWEVGAQESLLSRVIRIIRIWGSISKWACAGCRRNETYGPWQPESSFARLRVKLAEFQENLPRKLQYSQRSTDGHSQNEHSLSAYMVMHVVYFLSLIVLHRAYLPFLPLRCNEPVGPLDEPSFPREQYAVPDGFWRDSTRELFRAARNMMDLVIACQERGVLVETPLVGFAIYNAAFIGLYAAHFNHMDVDGYLSVRQQLLSPSSTGSGIMQPQLPTRKSLDILRDMRPRLGLATGWFRTLNRLHSYFVKVKKDFKSRSRSTDSLDGPMGLRPVREIGPVGGLEEFKLFEKVFLEFGNIDDQIPEAATGSGPMDEDVPNTIIALSERGGGGLALSDTASNAAVKSESGDSAMDGQKRGDPWVSVNSSKNLPPPPPLTPSASEGDLPRSEMDRRPSLPLPSRPLPPTQQPSSSSPYAFPSIQQHHNNSMSSSTASPSLPSLTAAVSTTQQPPPTSSQYAGTPTNRLQPINSWHHHQQQGPPPPPYSQSLPPINATTTATTAPHPSYAPPPPMLPLPGSVPYAPTPTSMITDYSSYPALWSTSLGGDDVIAFLADGSFELGRSTSCSEVGFSTGWLSAVWNDLG